MGAGEVDWSLGTLALLQRTGFSSQVNRHAHTHTDKDKMFKNSNEELQELLKSFDANIKRKHPFKKLKGSPF